MVFNKPEYRPGETVLFKAFVFKRGKKPLTKPLEISLAGNSQTIELATIQPKIQGNYHGSFALHDSMDLQTSRRYELILKNLKGKKVLEAYFPLSDYDLRKTSFTLKTDKDDYSKGDSVFIFARVSDDNNLNIFDAKVELTVTTSSVQAYHKNQVFVPDTIWQHDLSLDPIGETKIPFPTHLFPKYSKAAIISTPAS